jgi:magnesium and cobalt transporter
VYDGSIDNVVGLLRTRDLFEFFNKTDDEFSLARLVRPVLVVPESKPADELIDLMRTERRYLALVVDEFGGTAGILTLKDLLQALVGRIEEEPSTMPADSGTRSSAAGGDDELLVDGLMRLDDFEELADLRLDETAPREQ